VELAGRVRTIEEVADTLEISFQCCNHEVFDLIASPAIRPPLDTILRVWTQAAARPDNPNGPLVEVIVHWEDLSK